MYRIVRILFPPHPETLANMCKQGFDDALRFLHKNNLINCTKCLAVQSTFVVSNQVEENLVYDPQCRDCKMHRQVSEKVRNKDSVDDSISLKVHFVLYPRPIETGFNDKIDDLLLRGYLIDKTSCKIAFFSTTRSPTHYYMINNFNGQMSAVYQ